MDSKNRTAYCGIYCPDCIHYKNRYNGYARQLMEELEQTGFDQYAEIESPFGEEFKHYETFKEVLAALASTQCDTPCRVGGGCSGKPCKIMSCCLSRNHEGCWECDGLTGCDKFDFLEPRCGRMPKNNIIKIKELGIPSGIEQRDPFYIWQR